MDNSKSFWINEIENSQKTSQKWVNEAKDAIRIYRGLNKNDAQLGKGEFPFKQIDNVRNNILFSNTQLLLSTLFTTFPKPYITKRFSQQKDILGDTISEITERAVSYFIDCGGFDEIVRSSLLDYLLTGRGVCWIKYEPKLEQDTILEQNIKIDYVYWQDFRHSWAKQWGDVWWVGRRYYLNEQDLKDKFGNLANKISLKYESSTNKDGFTAIENRDSKDSKNTKFAEVWEIWNKRNKQRLFICNSYQKDEPLRIDEDPLGLEDFFPIPEPIFSIKTNDEVIPIPEFRIYFKQAMELNILSERITYITDTLKWCGLADAKFGEFTKKVQDLKDNQFLPVDIGAEVREQGGLASVFMAMPLNERIEAINTLYNKIEKVKEEIYEITGISDLMRSITAENQTATEAKIKGTFGSLRLVRRQEEVQRFIKGTIKIVAEIIAEHFTLENLQKITMYKLPTMQEKDLIAQKFASGQVSKEEDDFAKKPTWEQVFEVLRDEKLRDYRIDIETTSTAFDNAQLEKQERNEFLGQMNSLMSASAPLIQQAPESIDFVKELILFGLETHKTSRNMTENINGIFESIKNKLTQGEQQGQQPTDLKSQSDAKKNMLDAQVSQQKLELEKAQMALDAKFKEQEIALKNRELDLKAIELEQNNKELEYQKQLKIAEMDLQAKLQTQKDLVNTNIPLGGVRTLE